MEAEGRFRREVARLRSVSSRVTKQDQDRARAEIRKRLGDIDFLTTNSKRESKVAKIPAEFPEVRLAYMDSDLDQDVKDAVVDLLQRQHIDAEGTLDVLNGRKTISSAQADTGIRKYEAKMGTGEAPTIDDRLEHNDQDLKDLTEVSENLVDGGAHPLTDRHMRALAKVRDFEQKKSPERALDVEFGEEPNAKPSRKRAPSKKVKSPCLCGCGELSGGLWRPGHDARRYRVSKEINAGSRTVEDTYPPLVEHLREKGLIPSG